MRISEAAELTGLSISNIRFYEKKGLLNPARNQQSKYRDYSPEDIERLKQIILYRKIDIPLEKIHLLLCHETTLDKVLDEQMFLLKEKQEMLKGSMDLCKAMMEDSLSDPLDVDYYLNYVKDEEIKGHKFAEIEEILDDFAIYTKFNILTSHPAISHYLQNPKIRRIVQIIWSAALLLTPIIAIIDDCLDQNGISTAKLTYWIILITICLGSFLQYRKKYRE